MKINKITDVNFWGRGQDVPNPATTQKLEKKYSPQDRKNWGNKFQILKHQNSYQTHWWYRAWRSLLISILWIDLRSRAIEQHLNLDVLCWLPPEQKRQRWRHWWWSSVYVAERGTWVGGSSTKWRHGHTRSRVGRGRDGGRCNDAYASKKARSLAGPQPRARHFSENSVVSLDHSFFFYVGLGHKHG